MICTPGFILFFWVLSICPQIPKIKLHSFKLKNQPRPKANLMLPKNGEDGAGL